MSKKKKEIKWDRLDNTANLFPVIANESMTSVYRISVTLKEDVDGKLLQEALNTVLPLFDVFNVRLKKGVFWYYFETNHKEAPRVTLENTYPCRFLSPYNNRNYLFRVTYYQKRINLEVFHVLTDGLGAITFLKELTYQYLRLAHGELEGRVHNALSSETSLNKEDSYLKYYKKQSVKGYKTEKAYKIKGEALQPNELGVIHGYLDIQKLKEAAKKRGLSINTYLLVVYAYSIYKESLGSQPCKKPICICVPVNLRPYFDSITTKNFFTVVTAVFKPTQEQYSFEEILEIVSKSLKEQVNKENMERLISYGVTNERKLVIRAVPLFIKNIAVKWIYLSSAAANTTTMTNVGNVEISEEYQKYVERFHVILSMTQGQDMKCSIISYQDLLVYTFSSRLKDTSIQKAFFRKLSEEGIPVVIESNGVYYE